MKISEAQQEVRTVYLGAFSGMIVTSVIWFISSAAGTWVSTCLLYTSPSPRDRTRSRMPSSA